MNACLHPLTRKSDQRKDIFVSRNFARQLKEFKHALITRKTLNMVDLKESFTVMTSRATYLLVNFIVCLSTKEPVTKFSFHLANVPLSTYGVL